MKPQSWVAESVTLRHRYLLPEPPGQEDLYPSDYSGDLGSKISGVKYRHSDLIRALAEASLLQFNMLDPADRPANFRAVADMTEDVSRDVEFATPQWWSYHNKAVQSYLFFVRKHIESRSG